MRLNNNWMKHHGKLIRLILLSVVALVLVFTLCKRCTQVGGPSANEIYVPDSDEGFVKKANMLLEHLIEQGNEEHPKVKPHSISQLKERYPALEFALPYSGDAVEGARAADIRLVAINPDSIRDEKDRKFYYNSDIPALLEQQRKQLGERIFRIKFSSVDNLVIEKVEVNASMFKLALVKDPWNGNVMAAEDALFPKENHCFLAWGKSVVPVKQSKEGHIATGGGHEKVVVIDNNTHTITMKNGKPVAYYDLYKAFLADTTTICVRIPGSNETALYVDYMEQGKVRLRPVGCYCQPYDQAGPLHLIVPQSAAMKGEVCKLEKELKLVLTSSKEKEKLCELTITRDNPMQTLSMLTYSNQGRTRYDIAPQLTDRFTQQIIKGLSSTLTNTVYEDTVNLTIDPLMSLEMERELEKYANQLKNKGLFYKDDQWELSLTVMDMATGDVLAAPYYRSSDKGLDYDLAISRKNPALTRRFIGSTFKPLVALAAVLTKPELANLSTTNDYNLLEQEGNSKRKAMFYGHKTTAWSTKGGAAGFWNGCSSMSDFFARSDDVYPVALVAKALNYGQAGSPFKFTTNEVYLETNNNFSWPGAKFVSTLDHLYTLPSMKEYLVHDSLQMASYVWDNLNLKTDAFYGLDNVSPDPTLFHYENFNRQGATLNTELATWVLGQGTNDWNCLKLAEAWSRMLTKRKVEVSLVRPKERKTLPYLAEGFDNNAWNDVLEALLAAQGRSAKLLTPMKNAVDALNAKENIADTLLLFSKTGTPENYPRVEWKSVDGGPRWLDVGLYCMALVPKSAYRDIRNGKEGRGIMCVMRVTRIVNNKHKKLTASGNEDGIQSSDARNFFSANPALLDKFYHLVKPYLAVADNKRNDKDKRIKKKQ